MPHVQRRPCLLAAMLFAFVGGALLAPAAAPACRGAKAQISKASPAKLRSAMLCLVNRKRSANGLKSLKLDPQAPARCRAPRARHGQARLLRPPARRWPGPHGRLDRVGWNGRAWGENIAYGCGSASSPKATLRNWMNSPPHRDILLVG